MDYGRERIEETYDPAQDWDSSLEEGNKVCARRAVEDLGKGGCELIRILTELEGIKGVIETSETDDVECCTRKPGEHLDVRPTRVRRGGYLFQ